MNQDNEQGENEDRNKLDVQLESSFQSSFRSTYSNLKMYRAEDAAAEAAALAGSNAPGSDSGSSNANDSPLQSARLAPQTAQPAVSPSQLQAAAEPPAGWHAPHHSWLLGSHGGKKKPEGLRPKTKQASVPSPIDSGAHASPPAPAQVSPQRAPSTNAVPQSQQSAPNTTPATQQRPPNPGAAPVSQTGAPRPAAYASPPPPPGGAPKAAVPPAAERPAVPQATPEEEVRHLGGQGIPYSVDGAGGVSNLDVMKKIASEAPYVEPGSRPQPPPAPRIGSHPDDYRIPANALEPNPPLLGDHENLENPELFAPTVEVAYPIPVPDPYLKRLGDDLDRAPKEYTPATIDPEVAHLYAPTADVSKPVAISPNEQLHPSPEPSEKPLHWASPLNNDDSAPAKSQPPPGLLPSLPQPFSKVPPSLPPGVGEDELRKDDAVSKSRKSKLPSYIDRQIAREGIHEEEGDEEQHSGQQKQKKTVSPNKTIPIAIATVLGLAVVGLVAWQGAGNGGKSWIAFGGNNQSTLLSEKADVAIKNGSYLEAIGYLDSAIKLSPDQATLFQKRGLAKLELHRRDQFEAALEDLNLAIKKNPNLYEAYLDRAAVRIELGQFEQAIDDYDKLITAGKDTDKVRYGRGLAKYYSGDYSDAEAEFVKILELDSSNVEATIALGTTLYKGKSDKAGAENKFNQASRTDKSGLALRNLAILAYEQGAAGYNTARKYYSDAISTNPGDANLFNERGILRWAQKDPLGASTDFKSAIGRDPNLEIARQNLNFACKSLIDEGRSKIKQEPNSHVGYALVAYGLSKLGRYKDALFYGNEALTRNPRNIAIIELVGSCYKEMFLFEEAIEPLSIAISVNPNSADAYADRAWAYLKAGKDNEALKDATIAIQLNDTLTTPYIVRSSVLLDRGDYKGALENDNRLVRMEPKSAINYSNRALTYKEGGHIEDAEADLRHSIALDQSHWHGFRSLAELMQDTGRSEEAKSYFDRAVELNPGQETLPARISYWESIRNFDKAIEDCNKLIEINPYNPNNFKKRGLAFTLAEKYPEALKDYDSSIKLKEDGSAYAARAYSYLRSGELDKAEADLKKSLLLEPDGRSTYWNETLLHILRKDWSEATASADKAIALEGWEETSTYGAVLFKWVALNYEGKSLLAREVLADCQKHAGTFPWPTPLIKYLLGDIDFEQVKKQAENQTDMTDVYYYAGMKDYFDHNDAEARKKLEWVLQKGSMMNVEYMLAESSLAWMGAGGHGKEGQSK